MNEILVLRPVVLRQWGEEYLIYNKLTANTHLFDSVSGEVLKYIYHRDISKLELVQLVMENHDDLSVFEVTQFIEDMIEKFKEMDLLEIGL